MSESARCTEDIYAVLLREIISLQIKPGAAVSENALCERFGVSRTPIRTVLQRLQGQGYLSIVPYKGTTVTRLDYNAIENDIYARAAVESAVLRDFIQMQQPMDREAVAFALSEVEKEGNKYLSGDKDFDIFRFLDADIAMHRIWYKATHRLTLAPILTRPDAGYVRFMMLDVAECANVEDVLSDHRELLDIIDTRDLARIEPAVKRHLYGNIRRMGARLFTEFRDYFTPGSLPV